MKKTLMHQLMQLQIGEHLVMMWPDNTRPEKDGYMGFRHYTFHMEPLKEGLRFTRIEKKPENTEHDTTEILIVPKGEKPVWNQDLQS